MYFAAFKGQARSRSPEEHLVLRGSLLSRRIPFRLHRDFPGLDISLKNPQKQERKENKREKIDEKNVERKWKMIRDVPKWNLY